MDNKKINEIKHKITDFTRFSMVLVAVSVFLYIGMFIPNEGMNEFKINIIMIAISLLLVISLSFAVKTTKYKKQLQEYLDS